MIEIRRILCPIDFSDHSRRALDHAVAIAAWFESTVTVLHVCPVLPAASYVLGTPSLTVSPPSPQDQVSLLASMRRFAAAIESDVPLRFEIAEGNTASEIVERASATLIDVIVMGTHGRSGIEHLILGSVTEKVIRKARCPVLTVPRGMIDVVPAPPVLFERILCATDFSEASIRALDYALTLAQEADAHLTIMHVVEVTPAPQADVENALESKMLGAYVAAAADDRAERLESLIPDTARTYCTVDTKVAIGKAYREILRVASECETELIVLGAHGRAMSELLFGSTANQIVRQARCPVLTIR
jgi:nucleotide-binding universal stress UspA family protein